MHFCKGKWLLKELLGYKVKNNKKRGESWRDGDDNDKDLQKEGNTENQY